MSDFEDDENFGLTNAVEGKPNGGTAAQTAAGDEDEEDIYGDIAGPTSYQPLVAIPATKSDAGDALAEGKQVETMSLAVVERQNSGGLASTSRGTEASKLEKKVLPRKLADTKVVYVGELEWWTTDADIETICAEYGTIDSVTFYEEKATGKSKGYCLVRFETKEAANLCRHEMNGREINGRKCVVTFSYNSNAATKQSRQQQAITSQPPAQGYHSRDQNYSGRGTWGAHQGPMREGGMPLPPMPPWPNMGMGMTGLPMPGMGVSYIDSMTQPQGTDYKRRRY